MGEAGIETVQARELLKLFRKTYLPDSADLLKYSGHGLVYGSASRFFDHQLYEHRGSSIRAGLAAAGRTGMVAAFRTPLFACIEHSVATYRGKYDLVSYLLGWAASQFTFRTFRGNRSLRGVYMLFLTALPKPDVECSTYDRSNLQFEPFDMF